MSPTRSSPPSVLLCARDIRLGGGVAALAAQLAQSSDGAFALHRVGRRHLGGSAVHALGDPRRLASRLREEPEVRCVVLNPSARPRAILRDIALARVVRAHRRQLIVWWHGRDPRVVSRTTDQPWRSLLKWGFSGADCHLVLTDEMASWVSSWSPNVRVERTMTAWDETLFGGRVAEATSDAPWLFLGRLQREKGLWDAVAMLDRDASRRLLIAGAGPESRALEKHMSTATYGSRLRALGQVTGERKAEALLSAKGLLLPSYDEGAPLAVLEAMGVGIPVVAYDVGAIGEMVGDTGKVVRVGDVDALDEAMRWVASDPVRRRALADAGRARAAQWTSTAGVTRLKNYIGLSSDD